MDQIADMLTIIRNAQAVKHESIKVPYSKVSFGIVEILKKEGRVKGIDLKKRGEKSTIIVELAYESDGEPAIKDIQRVSKLGKRIYVGYKDIPIIRQGQGFAVLSTPKGIMSGREAKAQKVGGEILCKIY